MSLWKPESGRGHALSRFPSVSPWKPENRAWDMVPFQCFHPCHHENPPIWAETCHFNVSIRVAMETRQSGRRHAISMFPSVSPWKPANLGGDMPFQCFHPCRHGNPPIWAETCHFNVSIRVAMETRQSGRRHAISMFPSVSPWKPANLGGDMPFQCFHPCRHGNPPIWAETCHFNVSIRVAMETRQSGRRHAISMFPSVSPWKPANPGGDMPFQGFHPCHHGNLGIGPGTWCPFNVSIRVTMETRQSGRRHALSRLPSVSPWKLTNLGGDMVPFQCFYPCHHRNLPIRAGSCPFNVSIRVTVETCGSLQEAKRVTFSYQNLESPREDSHEEAQATAGPGGDPSRTGGR
ncbi:hypothetical protein MDA_GLEAN10010421 [Myotis davidii]|uniref:Uncharacterized protein n=1 Tax=Myotis davidii TaxID=225400 RepID=L5MGZ7_MYODS|nr:hypothetical protein MDA_GLEAN10010421 [Myotis davidii]